MLTQENKPFTIDTPLGEDVMLLAGFDGQEGISEMFRFEIRLLSEHQSIVIEDIIGKKATIHVFLPWTQGYRYFNGIISGFSQEFDALEDEGQHLFSYSATLVPSLWLLTRTSDSRIFQEMSVPNIVEQIFSEYELSDYRIELNGEYRIREYTVQYNETDFDFISRLLEDEGIYYFFSHEQGQHTLVLADHAGASLPCPDQEPVRFLRSRNQDFGDEDLIDQLRLVSRIRAGKYTLRDYNYLIPDTGLEVSYDTAVQLGPGERERYDYPGGYTSRKAGDKLASVRIETQESRINIWNGTSTCRVFSAGFRFELKESFQEDWNDKAYILTRIRHKMDQAATYLSGSPRPETGRTDYENQFECIPHDVPYRPLQKTPVPVIEGVQTAFVVGPKGEEIYTDEHGRIKVQFHWDREGKYDENSTCWIRVAQYMAGNGWGAVHLPRIGHEVIVEFIDGNPDRPIVTGQVYHGINRPPYTLPDEKTKSAFKSSSSPGGDGFNEIRFEDKAGREQVFIHAQKNQDIRVKNDCYEWVGRDRHLIVKTDQFVHTENNYHKIVGADHKESIGRDRHLTVKGKQALKVDQNISSQVGGNIIETIGGSQKKVIGGALQVLASGAFVVESGSGVCFKCGASNVVIGPGSITLEAPMIVLDGKLVKINSGPGAPFPKEHVPGSSVEPLKPSAALEADVADPGAMAKIREQQVAAKTGKYGKEKPPAHKPPDPPEETEKKHWVEIKLKDQEGNPVPGEAYEIQLPDGTVAQGALDSDGFARVDGIDPGTCQITFPNMDRDCWEPE